jgi:transcriptional regulator with XRE-family HTH domain
MIEVVMGCVSYDADVRHDGRVHAFTIPQLRLPVCRACGEKVFTMEVDDQISDALRVHLRLLPPDEMRGALERLNMTQKEAAERLGVAEATLSRWLTNTQIQSRAMDNLLRLFFGLPEARTLLRGMGQDPEPGPKDPVDPAPAASDPSGPVNRIREHFPHLQDPERASSRKRAFEIAPGVN